MEKSWFVNVIKILFYQDKQVQLCQSQIERNKLCFIGKVKETVMLQKLPNRQSCN